MPPWTGLAFSADKFGDCCSVGLRDLVDGSHGNDKAGLFGGFGDSEFRVQGRSFGV